MELVFWATIAVSEASVIATVFEDGTVTPRDLLRRRGWRGPADRLRVAGRRVARRRRDDHVRLSVLPRGRDPLRGPGYGGRRVDAAPPDQRAQLAAAFEAEPFQAGDRTVTSWVQVPVDDATLGPLVPYVEASYETARAEGEP
ncbi:hypothetical protein ACFQH8_09260 [Halomicroarcula sp. GCM10025710]